MINPPEPHNYGFFGINIAMSETRIVIGEYGASSAHIYDRDGKLIKTLKSTQGNVDSYFSSSVAVFGDYIVVGEPYATVDGIEAAGQIHVYDASGNHVKTIHPQSPRLGGQFGFSLAADSDTLVVGEAGVFCDDGNFTNKVYLLDSELTFLDSIEKPVKRVGNYAWSVAICGDLLVVGEPYAFHESGSFFTRGWVHLYNISDSRPIMSLESPRGIGFGNFGYSVSFGGDVIAVGEVRADANSTMMAGTAHIYSLNGTLIKTLYPEEPRQYGYFGVRVFATGDYVAVTQAGHVYIYDHKGKLAYAVSENPPLVSAYFGYDVAIEGDRLAAGVNSASVDGSVEAGMVYLYQIKLPEPSQGSNFNYFDTLLIVVFILVVVAGAGVIYRRYRRLHLASSHILLKKWNFFRLLDG